MTEKPSLIELHDAELSAVQLRAAEATFVFAQMSAFFATVEAEVFDVRSCAGTLIVRGLTSVRIQTPMAPGTRVSSGEVLVDDERMALSVLGKRTGQCRVELQLGDGTGAMVEGTALEFTLAQIGEVFEQWRGPLLTSPAG